VPWLSGTGACAPWRSHWQQHRSLLSCRLGQAGELLAPFNNTFFFSVKK
jgi:hypothetical protein